MPSSHRAWNFMSNPTLWAEHGILCQIPHSEHGFHFKLNLFTVGISPGKWYEMIKYIQIWTKVSGFKRGMSTVQLHRENLMGSLSIQYSIVLKLSGFYFWGVGGIFGNTYLGLAQNRHLYLWEKPSWCCKLYNGSGILAADIRTVFMFWTKLQDLWYPRCSAVPANCTRLCWRLTRLSFPKPPTRTLPAPDKFHEFH